MRHMLCLAFLLLLFACHKDDNNSVPDNSSRLSLDSLQVLPSDIPRAVYSDLTFINDTTGFAITQGFIAKTTNGGSTWTSIEMPVNTPLKKIQFTDDQTGYIIGGDNTSGVLLKTTDGGQNWSVSNLNSLESPTGMFFINSSEGFITGKNLFIKTVDGGATWTSQKSPEFRMFQDVNFKNSKEGYATSNGGLYYKTTNGGNLWISSQYKAANYLYNIYFAGNKTLLVSSPDSLVDIGNNYAVLNTPYDAKKLLFLDDQKCLGIGFHYPGGFYPNGDILITDNGWKTFTEKTFSVDEATGFTAIAKMSDNKTMIIGSGALQMTVLIFKQ